MTPPTAGGSVFKPAFMLMSGRALGFVAAFAIPVVLVRLFDQAEFGTYKQLFLIYTTLYGIAQLGMAESLYYFLPMDPTARGRYVSNSLLALGAAGLACLALLWTGSHAVAAWFHNPALAAYIPQVGIYLLLMLMAAVFEIVMITRKHHGFAFGAYALSDLVRAGLFVLPGLLFHSLAAVFAGAVCFAALRLCTASLYLRREFPRQPAFDAGLMKKQLAYALPFALAVGIEAVQRDLHMYVVSNHFDAAVFAVYSVGCLQVPLVDFMMTSTSSVMMVRMSEDLRDGHRAAALELWLDTTRKLTLVFAFLVGGLMVCADKLIVLLFTASYAAAAPLFTVWTLSMLFMAIMTDSMLRVHADTRFLILLNVIRLAVVALAITGFLAHFGLMGAVLVTLLATLTAKAVGLVRIRKLLGCGYADLLPWKGLGTVVAIAAASMLPCLALRSLLALSPLPSLLILGTAYAVSYIGLTWRFGPLSETERRAVLQYLPLPAAWTSGNRRA
ncbi:MAG TPA: polysaccharide biosynthesis C-terminal domain-containing protein [Gammaproteobacteria bacterium]|jgi:O-antigen/teichoic acid export membrane protein|nr:polysaccharide biosynthesis C-terminal domain-containing protein [Gammaproteobacteria bacterium]